MSELEFVEIKDKNSERANEYFGIRKKVFIIEQNVPENEEIDKFDDDFEGCIHLLALCEGHAAGTGRLIPRNEAAPPAESACQIGRIAVLPEFRRRNIAREMVKYLIESARAKKYKTIALHSQTYVVKFYESMGFTGHGETFFEAGIPHLEMCMKL